MLQTLYKIVYFTVQSSKDRSYFVVTFPPLPFFLFLAFSLSYFLYLPLYISLYPIALFVLYTFLLSPHSLHLLLASTIYILLHPLLRSLFFLLLNLSFLPSFYFLHSLLSSPFPYFILNFFTSRSLFDFLFLSPLPPALIFLYFCISSILSLYLLIKLFM